MPSLCVVVRHDRRNRPAETFDERFDAAKEEQTVLDQRPTHRAAKLVPREVWLAERIEVVRCVESVVAKVLVGAARVTVAARLRQDIDLTAGDAPELRAVGICLDAKLAHGLHSQGGAGSAPCRAVGEVVLQRTVEQVDVRARVLPVDADAEPVRHHRAAIAMRIREHARLQQSEVRVVAAVERQRLDRLGGNEVAELRPRSADDRHGGLIVNGDGFLRRRSRARCEGDVIRNRQRYGAPMRRGSPASSARNVIVCQAAGRRRRIGPHCR